MGNTNSRRYNLERPYGYPYRSYVESYMSFPIGATDRFAVSLPQLPDVVNENNLLYQLALARRDIFWNNYLRDRWLLCDLKCTSLSRSLPHLPLGPSQVIPLPPPPLRHTASDEDLERAAIALCCRKRLLPPCAPTPPTKPLVCTKNHCEVLDSKIKDACERKCFWKRFVSGELEEGEGGAGAALRIALEAPPLTCVIPPSAQQCIPNPPCAGQGLPLRPPNFACPPATLNTNACPVTCLGANPVQNYSAYTSGDMQRTLDSAWLTGVAASPTIQPSMPCTQPPPSLWVSPNTTLPHTSWNQTLSSYMPCTHPCPSQTQVIPPQFQNLFAPPLPLQQPPPPLQPPTPPPPIHPIPQQCPPAQVQFAEALEVGCASAGDVSVALYTDAVLEARALGVQSQGGRFIRSILSRRWTLPSEIRPEALWCFLGGGLLAVVALPPPPTLIAVLRAMQCLGRPLLVPYSFTEACGVVLT